MSTRFVDITLNDGSVALGMENTDLQSVLVIAETHAQPTSIATKSVVNVARLANWALDHGCVLDGMYLTLVADG